MVERVIKRDGRKTVFSVRRIRTAISNAMNDAGVSTYNTIQHITDTVVNAINAKYDGMTPTVEQIQDTIIEVLKKMKLDSVAQAFKEYREERTAIREKKSDIMRAINRIGAETERDNANVGNNFSAKLLQIASIANKWTNLANMPKEHAKFHESGDGHIHDLDSFNLSINCLHIPTAKLLSEGFNTGYGTIRSPKRISSAAELICIMLQASQNDMFGGQSHPNFDTDLAPYYIKTIEENKKEIANLLGKEVNELTDEENSRAEKLAEKELYQAMQAVVYNLNSMHSRAGSQVPFSSLNIGYVTNDYEAKVCEAFLTEYDKGLGKGEQPIFPNIIFRLKKGVNANPEDKYYYLYELACRVAGNRMNPTFRILDSSIDLPYVEKGIIPATMGCRTNVMSNINGEEGPIGRGNNFPITINLVRIGIEAEKNWNKFYKLLIKAMDLCDEQLMYRYEVTKKLKVKDLPFVAGQKLMMGSENLNPDDSIEPIIKNGTFGIGFIGLAETMIAMTGHHHGEDEEYWKKAYEIVEFMRKKVDEYKAKRDLNYSLYATPAEGVSGRFVPMDRKRYGIIKGVTDKDYYTNSYHIPVNYPISALKKIELEAPFHKLCNGGFISYVEIDGGTAEERARFIKRHLDWVMNNTDACYVGYNFHIRYCIDCGHRIEDGSATCPICGSDKIQGVSRVTGYMSLDERFTPGKVAERKDRIKHQ